MSIHISKRALLQGASAIRTVRADAADPKTLIEGIQKAFAAFKSENDEKFKDVVRSEKIERINADIGALQAVIDDVNVKLAAIAQGAGEKRKALPGEDPEYRQQFASFFRSGENEAAVKKASVQGPRAALSVGVGADGGFTAPVEWDRTIIDSLKEVSPMRQICTVRSVGTQTPTKLWNQRGATSGWVAETAARPQTNTSTLQPISFPMGQIYAMPSATQDILDDSLIDIEAWHAQEVLLEFDFQEGQAFVDGSGVNRPKGFLTYATAQAEHPGGAIPTVQVTGAAITADSIINVAYDLPSAFWSNARYVMNRPTHAIVRRLKTTTNEYLWQPSFALGQPPTLNGYPITEVPGMPNQALNARPIAFGDFRQGYHIIDRMGVRVLRDPYTAKPYVLFYTTKRVGGGVANPQALRLLQVVT